MRTLAELRSERKMTQAQLAKQLGVHKSTVACWENGHRTPRLEDARRIARLFGIQTDDIFFGSRDCEMTPSGE